MVISAPGVSQEALNVTDSAKSAAAASSSNYPNIFRLFESDSAPHLAPQRWSKRMKLKLRVTRKEWWASLAASSEERRPLAHRQAWCQTRGTGYTPRIQRETGYKLSWTPEWNVTIARSFSERYGQIVTGVQFVARMATGVEIPFWIFGQQKWVSGINRNTTCQEVSVSRRNLRGRMGWEYAKMFPWLISDHVHCVSSYAQIRIVISKGKKV